MRRCWMVALLAVAASAGVLAASAGAGKGPFAPEDCTRAEARPERITISCADDGIFVDSINWSNWGGNQSSGTGILHVNKCKPSCVAGNFKEYPVNLAVTKPKPRKCGTKKRVKLYRIMYLNFPQNQPSQNIVSAVSKSKMFCNG